MVIISWLSAGILTKPSIFFCLHKETIFKITLYLVSSWFSYSFGWSPVQTTTREQVLSKCLVLLWKLISIVCLSYLIFSKKIACLCSLSIKLVVCVCLSYLFLNLIFLHHFELDYEYLGRSPVNHHDQYHPPTHMKILTRPAPMYFLSLKRKKLIWLNAFVNLLCSHLRLNVCWVILSFLSLSLVYCTTKSVSAVFYKLLGAFYFILS